jgi:hypothetical protein
MFRALAATAAMAVLLPLATTAQQPATPEDPVAYALSAAPSYVSDQAAVMDMEGNILREGTNGWTCVPVPGGPMCMDEQWMSWMDAYLNQKDETGVTAVGLAYMLRGDSGASNINPYDEAPTAGNDWVVTGPHLMIVVPDPALLDGIPDDPASGAPYVMWRGHPLVHVMIPVDETGTRMHGHQ